MQVKLEHHSPLEIIVKAIRKCYASEDKSDSKWTYYDSENQECTVEPRYKLGYKDMKLIERIIESDHTSTLEHLSFTFDIDGLSRAALQELARHRHASLSVKSTRYTLKELIGRDFSHLMALLVPSGCEKIDEMNRDTLDSIRCKLSDGDSNDLVKYLLPEAFKTSLVWTINARSLRNFLKLRSSKRALWEMQDLAEKVYDLIPSDMRFMFEDCYEEH